jgi:hypothetical protein
LQPKVQQEFSKKPPSLPRWETALPAIVFRVADDFSLWLPTTSFLDRFRADYPEVGQVSHYKRVRTDPKIS